MKTIAFFLVLWTGDGRAPPVPMPQPYASEQDCKDAGEVWANLRGTNYSRMFYVCIPGGY